MKKPIPKPSMTELWERFGGEVHGGNRGGWQKAKCILHDDRSASASVNEDECRWRCHTCDESGDAIDLIMRIENVGWSAALEVAKGLTGGGDNAVSRGGGSSSLLPRGSGNRRGGGHFVPPWLRD